MGICNSCSDNNPGDDLSYADHDMSPSSPPAVPEVKRQLAAQSQSPPRPVHPPKPAGAEPTENSACRLEGISRKLAKEQADKDDAEAARVAAAEEEAAKKAAAAAKKATEEEEAARIAAEEAARIAAEEEAADKASAEKAAEEEAAKKAAAAKAAEEEAARKAAEEEAARIAAEEKEAAKNAADERAQKAAAAAAKKATEEEAARIAAEEAARIAAEEEAADKASAEKAAEEEAAKKAAAAKAAEEEAARIAAEEAAKIASKPEQPQELLYQCVARCRYMNSAAMDDERQPVSSPKEGDLVIGTDVVDGEAATFFKCKSGKGFLPLRVDETEYFQRLGSIEEIERDYKCVAPGKGVSYRSSPTMANKSAGVTGPIAPQIVHTTAICTGCHPTGWVDGC
eukprot:TRINITY_DN15973_c0_g1_i2.p1 TRINITY_DN15973_c0_g1~~TRINITY_DN15973_c0_g1_i2.p1  ORF type:complete len:398 (-),score=169.51 TRINITY_DN15973_c0_g1_i2:591-1784(-)